ncbi:MAG: PAS domain S-box protein [Candidatus Aminicenantes bacterium]|nr:PAS domain S-box protein [Candidatus Aminicenantes bacterium]
MPSKRGDRKPKKAGLKARPRPRPAAGRRKSEAERAEVERRVQGILMGSPVPCFIIDTDHRVRYWNRALAVLSGVKPSQVIGTRDQWRAFYPKKRPCLADLLIEGDTDKIARWYGGKGRRSALAKKGFEAVDFFPALGPKGRWIQFTAAAIRDASGILQGAIETLEDITEQKRAEEALKASEEKHRRLVEDLSEVIFSVDAEGRISYVSPPIESVLGYRTDQIIGQRFDRFIHPDDLPGLTESFRRTLAGDLHPYEYRLVARDGRVIHVQSSSRTIQDGGRTIGLLGVLTDISERKKAEEELRASEEKYRGLFENAFDAIYQSTPQGRILTVNPAMVRMLGYGSREELLSVPVVDTYLNPADRLRMADRLEREGEVRDYELVLKRKDGTPVHVIQNTHVVRDAAGRILYYEGTLTDVSELKRAEGQIMAKLREKEVLLKEINHRVKNNLQIVSSLLRLQSERVRHPEAKDILRGSISRIRAMALAHETLYQSEDLSRIDMADFLRRLTNHLAVSFNEQTGSVRIEVEAGDVTLDVIRANPCGLIINELVTNALRHAFAPGKAGTVLVGIYREGPAGRRIVVRDNGRGFPPELDFRKTETLGLQIVTGLVEQLDGEIAMTPEPGGGTAFTIRF